MTLCLRAAVIELGSPGRAAPGMGSLRGGAISNVIVEWCFGKVGECRDGEELNGTSYNNNGNIFGKWVNGKLIKK